jgi:hypothetical protein
MRTLRTTNRLTKSDARRLMKGGYDIDYIETIHRSAAEETTIVWSRPARPNDIPEFEIPY